MTSSHSAGFELLRELSNGVLLITFKLTAGPAGDVSVRWAQFKDGSPIRGDGLNLGALARDVTVAIYDRAEIDSTSVLVDFPVQVSPDTSHGVFLNWTNDGEVAALGVLFDRAGGEFRNLKVVDVEQGIDVMREKGMLQPGDLQPIIGSVRIFV